MWRVRELVEREGVGLAEQIRGRLPLVAESDVHKVENNFSSAGEEEGESTVSSEEGSTPTTTGAVVVPFEDEEVFVSKAAEYSCLTARKQILGSSGSILEVGLKKLERVPVTEAVDGYVESGITMGFGSVTVPRASLCLASTPTTAVGSSSSPAGSRSCVTSR